MKRILSCSLALLMLLLAVPIFSSCGKNVDLSLYGVVFVEDEAAYTKRKCTDLINAVTKATGKEPGATSAPEGADKIAGEKFELLVGNTNRPESAEALEEIDGFGYSVTTSGDKIVLIGTTDLLTAMAVDYFINTYLSSKALESGTLKVVDEIFDEMPVFEVEDSVPFVYPSMLDGKGDAENLAIKELKSLIEEISDVRGVHMPEIKDNERIRDREIVVGAAFNRTSVHDVLASLDAYKYGVVVREGQVVIGGTNYEMLSRAKQLFADVLHASVYISTGGKKEKTLIALPIGFSEVCDSGKSDYTYEFPRPEGLSLMGTLDVQDGSVEYLYRGDALNTAFFENYCATLTANGYTLYTSNAIENSLFRIYNNSAAGISLSVSFDAYKHAEAGGLTYPISLRVVASRLDKINLMPAEYLSQDLSFTKLQNSAISALRVEYADPNNWGNIYIVTLEDGSFIVLDGGTGTAADVDRIYECLLDLYKRGHGGNEPTTERPIDIVAWYLSHPHGDHYVNMERFINQYCVNYEQTPVTIKYLLANFTSPEEHHNSNNPNIALYNRIASLSAKIHGGMKYIKLHTGQSFHIANIDFEVLYTHEHLYPTQLHTYNNSSTVIRMTLNHTENGALTGGRETMLWLGDAQASASKFMRAMYGDYLRSDMVQVAHHGLNGCELELYRLVAPECVWWPAGRAEWKEKYHNPASTGYYQVSYQINYGIASIKYIILSDDFNYTVSITATGADYRLAKDSPTGVFSAGETTAAQLSSFSGDATCGFMYK